MSSPSSPDIQDQFVAGQLHFRVDAVARREDVTATRHPREASGSIDPRTSAVRDRQDATPRLRCLGWGGERPLLIEPLCRLDVQVCYIGSMKFPLRLFPLVPLVIASELQRPLTSYDSGADTVFEPPYICNHVFQDKSF